MGRIDLLRQAFLSSRRMYRRSGMADEMNVNGVKPILLSLLAVLVLCTAGRGEPLPMGLTRLMSQLTEWLTAREIADAPASVAGATVISLDRATKRDLATLASRLNGGRLLASAVYTGKPTSLASDLSQQLRAIEDVPADLLKPLIVDETQATRVDEIACAWAFQLLEANSADAVAAAVYWYADERTHSLLDGAEPRAQLVLVLVRMTRDSSDGELKVGRVAWGPVDSIR